MATTAITFTVTGVPQLQQKLKRMGMSLVDMTKSFSEIGAYLATYYRDNVFTSQGNDLGEPWARLSDSTMKQKVAAGFAQFASTPLVRTQKMQNSFYFTPSPLSVVIANKADYFKYHQSAAPRGSKLPRRVMMAITEQHIVTIKAVLLAELESKMRGA